MLSRHYVCGMTAADPAILSPVAVPRRGAKLGAWALISAGIALLWVALTVVFALASFGSGGATGPIAYGMFFIGFIVVPVGLIASIVLAVAAFVRNRVLGKVLAGIALLLVLLAAVLMIGGMMGSSGLFALFT